MTFLVVDESRTLRTMLRRALDALPEVEVIEAGDAAEAIATLGRVAPDLILTDVHRSGADGFALIEHVRAAGNRIPIVVMTRAGERRDLDRARALDVAAFVSKPVRQQVIVETLRGLVGASR